MVDPIFVESWKCSNCQKIHADEKKARWCCFKDVVDGGDDCPDCDVAGGKTRERLALEKMMEMLFGNKKLILQSDMGYPYELTLVELGTGKYSYNKPISQVHTHCSFCIEGNSPEDIRIAVESFIHHILGDTGLSWSMDFEKSEEEYMKHCPNCKHYEPPEAYWDNERCKIGQIPDCPDAEYPEFEEKEG